jgi:thiamine-phosphate pyrophosphorylase
MSLPSGSEKAWAGGRRVWPLKWSLYVVTDSRIIGSRSLIETVSRAIRGGAGIIQYREKSRSTRQMIHDAKSLCDLCHGMGAAFLINDRLDVALAVNADGVHVGQEDMPVDLARTLLGPGKLLGVSVRNLDQLRDATRMGADYLSVSPVFATATKPDHEEPVGLQGLKLLAREAHLPVVAIGGINRRNAAAVVGAGAQGLCVISEVLGADDPEETARELVRIIGTARGAMER